jgi:hypothetical protein
MQLVVPQIWICATDIGHAQHRGDMFNRGTGKPAFLFLSAPEKRDDGRGLPPLRVFGDLALCPSLIRRGKGEGRGLVFV